MPKYLTNPSKNAVLRTLAQTYIFRWEAIFMLPVNSGGHSAYQDFLLDQLRKYYPVPDFFSHSTWDIIDRFRNLDLSFTDEFMWDKYSVFGPKPRTPSCMQRSFLLSIDFKVTSLTDWAAQLKINPLYAILSGFEFGDTPGVGTFYDFLNRLWYSDSDNLSPHIHPTKDKAKKPKIKGSKAAPVEKVSVEQLLPKLENTAFRIEEQPYGSLFQLYKNEFLDQSISKGLITPENLALAGTPPKIPGITAMTYTCSSLPILKVICLFSRCSHLLLPMIPTGSCIAFSG
ncbi:hypothetical protein [Enterocloster bolteae]|uniref:hypothetical protein n=1 Tax=Enterocloster bolteae TaxID=208479 RepID=UPI002108D70F|nr:hypothetical protein [Enterocloster bolteae]